MPSHSTSTSESSSSRASSLFSLDEDDSKASILVYKYRFGSSALEVTSPRNLCRELDQDPSLAYLRVTRKKIPRGNSRLEILTKDLLSDEDQARFSDNKPTLQSSLANVGLPASAYWKRMLLNAYPDLYIVSRSITPSPESSKDNSPESSQNVSPSSTFPVDTPHALREREPLED